MQSEFRNRQPPPTYHASEHDYHQQPPARSNVRTTQPPTHTSTNPASTSRGRATADGDTEAPDNYSLPSSPPPTYRSQASLARPGLHITFPPNQSDQPSSRPPTYRSHTSTMTRPGLPKNDSSDDEGGTDNPACDATEGESSNPPHGGSTALGDGSSERIPADTAL